MHPQASDTPEIFGPDLAKRGYCVRFTQVLEAVLVRGRKDGANAAFESFTRGLGRLKRPFRRRVKAVLEKPTQVALAAHPGATDLIKKD